MIEYLKYVFGSYHPKYKKLSYKWPGFKVILCRVKEHPNGVMWYNTGGLEPNMRCRDCGEDLG